ncbi:hypothetical protein [Metakosakonia massiliensis]|uniref:DUF4051 domain-containing protein n=1 Tax=Phytobacter massiliensis TaxID=1485952 RepID=A0A6N2YL18_9ENTR
MVVSWFCFLVVLALMAGYIVRLRRYCRAYRQERDAIQEGYHRALLQLEMLQPQEESTGTAAERTAPGSTLAEAH